MNQTIGKRIQTLRKQNGMSQQDLSDKLNITRQTISKWESDQTLPDLNTLLKMAELFNVSIAYIVGVEEDNKSISQMYELMQTLLNNQQKQNKTRNIIQMITIILCILSLGLNISMKHEMTPPVDIMDNIEASTTPFSVAYSFTKDRYSIITDNPYVMSGSYINVVYYDLENMMVSLRGIFHLTEYNEKTSAMLEFYNFDEPISIELNHQEGNLYTFNGKFPIEDYHQVILRIDDGKGNVRSTELTESVPHNYFSHVLFSQMNLFVPLGSNGKLLLNKLEFDPTYYNTSNDNTYMGYLDGYLKIKIYTTSKNKLIEEFTVSYDQKVTLDLKEDLPLNTPIYFEVNYFVDNPNNEDSFIGQFGHFNENDGQINYFSFMISNTNERVRILQMPIFYYEELETYIFKD